MTQELLPKPAVIRMLPLTELVIPPWNPRKFIDEAEMADLVAYVAKGKYVRRIEVLQGEAPLNVISGQRRVEAYRRLGKTHIEAEVMEVSLEEARVLAITSNEGAPLYWLDRYESWEPFLREEGKWTQEELAGELGVDPSHLGRADNLLRVLNPASRILIREQLQKSNVPGDAENKGNNDILENFQNVKKPLKKATSPNEKKWRLNENTALTLADLWDKRSLEEAQGLATQALEVMLAGKFNGPQTDQLVAHLAAGKGVGEFKLGVREKKAKAQPEAKANPIGEGALSGTGVASSSTTGYSPVIPRNDSGNSDLGKEPRNDTKGTAQPEAKANPVGEEAYHKSPPPPFVKGGLEGDLGVAGIDTPNTSSQAVADSPQLGQGKAQTESDHANAPMALAQPDHVAQPEASQQVTSTLSNMGWKILAGLPLLAGVQAKLKKGEKLTPGEMVVLVLHSLSEAGVWTWKHLLKPTLHLIKKVGLWLARHLWRWGKASAAGLARLMGRTTSRAWEMVAPALFVILVALVLWNWGVNHVTPGEQVRRLGAWTWHQIVSVMPFHGDSKAVTAKAQEQPKANPVGETALSGTEVAASQTDAYAASAPRNDSGNSDLGKVPRNDSGNSNLGKEAPPTAQEKPQAKAQGDALSQAGDVVGKAAGGIGAAKKLFGL